MGMPPPTPIEQLTRRVEAAEQQVHVLTIQVETMAALLRDAITARKDRDAPQRRTA